MEMPENQHFLDLRGLFRAEIFEFENFHLQLILAGLRIFWLGVHMNSEVAPLAKHVVSIWFL